MAEPLLRHPFMAEQARRIIELEQEVARLSARLEEAERPDPEKVARLFHETYERLAPSFDYTTRKESAKPWESVPLMNKQLMIETCRQVFAALSSSEPEDE